MNDGSKSDAMTKRPIRPSAVWKYFGIALTALALLVGAAFPASAAELARITFVRHGESAGNASGLIDTKTPGPVLTDKGQQQAQAVVDTLGDNNYDGIYASTMVRTQLTAAPMSQYLRLPIQVLPGLQEIEAGVFEGTPEAEAANGYAKFPLAWAFQGMRDLRIPGWIDGNEFDARMDGALKTIYDGGDRNAVVFSHGGSIMFWTMMNVSNLTLEQKINLLRTAQLDNTDYVVIEGNPEDGWTLVNWNGQQFSPEPTLGAEVQLQLRTLTRQLAATTKQIVDAFATRDIGQFVTAINRGVADAVYSVAKFGRAVNAKIVRDVTGAQSPTETSDTPEVAANAKVATVASTTDSEAPDTSDTGNVTALRKSGDGRRRVTVRNPRRSRRPRTKTGQRPPIPTVRRIWRTGTSRRRESRRQVTRTRASARRTPKTMAAPPTPSRLSTGADTGTTERTIPGGDSGQQSDAA